MAGIGYDSRLTSSVEELHANLGRRSDDSRPPSSASKASSRRGERTNKTTKQDSNPPKFFDQATVPSRIQANREDYLGSRVDKSIETSSLLTPEHFSGVYRQTDRQYQNDRTPPSSTVAGRDPTASAGEAREYTLRMLQTEIKAIEKLRDQIVLDINFTARVDEHVQHKTPVYCDRRGEHISQSTQTKFFPTPTGNMQVPPSIRNTNRADDCPQFSGFTSRHLEASPRAQRLDFLVHDSRNPGVSSGKVKNKVESTREVGDRATL